MKMHRASRKQPILSVPIDTIADASLQTHQTTRGATALRCDMCGEAIEGEPADVVAIVEDYGRWLAASPLPKLFICAEPGSLLIGGARDFCRTWPNQKEISVRGIHFIQEDSPHEIGRALASFIEGLPT